MKFFRLGTIAFFAVSLSAQSNNAQQPVFQAIQRGDTAVVSRLIDSGISPNVTDEEAVPALMLATLFAVNGSSIPRSTIAGLTILNLTPFIRSG